MMMSYEDILPESINITKIQDDVLKHILDKD